MRHAWLIWNQQHSWHARTDVARVSCHGLEEIASRISTFTPFLRLFGIYWIFFISLVAYKNAISTISEFSRCPLDWTGFTGKSYFQFLQYSWSVESTRVERLVRFRRGSPPWNSTLSPLSTWEIILEKFSHCAGFWWLRPENFWLHWT